MSSTPRFLSAPTRVGAALLVALLLIGCRAETPAPATTTAPSTNAIDTEGLIVRRLESDINTLNPVLMSTAYERDVLAYLFDGLIEIDAAMEPAPGIATRWVVSPDATTFTFHLDPRASFDDGTPVTAADVLFSVKKYAEDSSQLSGYLQGIDFEKSRVVDPATVEVGFTASRSAGQ
ncbi:MAG: ABC transporter substrate-binding protein, partial [Thermoanaerobaculia bacterium]